MLAWSLAFYGLYLLGCGGAIPWWFFGVCGVLVVLRYFNRWHEAIHANQRRAALWHPARDLIILMGPFYLERRELEEQHLIHHHLDGAPGDPDLPIMQRNPLRGLLWSLAEPEMRVMASVRRRGLSFATVRRMSMHAAAWAGLMWLGGWDGLVAYNLAARVGNGLAWFVFSWMVHQSWFYGQVYPREFPRVLVWLWITLVGRENYYGVRFHYLHHVFPSVPDRDLPELAERLRTRTGSVAMTREAA